MYVGCSKSLTVNSRCQNGVSSQRFTTNKRLVKKREGMGAGVDGEDFHSMMQVGHLWKGDRMRIGPEKPPTSVPLWESLSQPSMEPQNQDSHRLPFWAELVKHPSVLFLCPITGWPAVTSITSALPQRCYSWRLLANFTPHSWSAISFLKRDCHPSIVES